jgi:DNA-binding LacI/PurR family transcriptional regulator
VSRAINRPETVADETRLKVKKAMDSLNYKPSAAARVLARGKNGVIGFLTQAGYNVSYLLGLLVEGINQPLLTEDYLLSVATIRGNEDIDDFAKSPLLRQHTCDGFVLNVPGSTGNLMAFCNRLRVPCVLINPATLQSHDSVTPADQQNAEKAVNYLVAKGHRRIAYLTERADRHLPSTENRERGYEIAMYRAGLQPYPLFNKRFEISGMTPEVRLENALRQTRERLDGWLSQPQPPTAILTYNADTAINVMQIAYERRWFIPEQFSVMSCDHAVILDHSPLPITAMNLDHRKIGEQATKMLLEKIDSPDEKIPTRYIEGTVIEGKSVASI